MADLASLWSRLRTLWAGASNSAPGATLIRYGGTAAYRASGWDFLRVANSVYGNPTGYRCIEAIGNNFSRPSWQLRKPGHGDVIEKHPLLDALNHPAPRMSGTMMQRAISRDLQLCGKSFWVRMQGTDGFGLNGSITGFRRLPPHRVTVIGDQDDELLGFVYLDRVGRQSPILPDSVLYLRFPHPERPFDGLAPAIIAGLPCETDTQATRFNYDLLSNDSALPGYLVVEGLTPDQFQDWRDEWKRGDVTGKTRFLGTTSGSTGAASISYQVVGQTNQQLTYSELRTDSQDDIRRAFGVPPVATASLAGETYANADAEMSSFLQQTVGAIWALVGDEATVQIGEEVGVEVGFDVSEIEELQEASDAVVTRGVQLLGAQAITINELREDLSMDPVAWGDIPVIQQTPTPPAFMPLPPDPNAPKPPPDQPPLPPKPGAPPALAPPDQPKPDQTMTPQLTPDAGGEVGREKAALHPFAVEFNREVEGLEAQAERMMQRFFDRQSTAIAKRVAGMSVAKLMAATGSGPQQSPAPGSTTPSASPPPASPSVPLPTFPPPSAAWWDAVRWDLELQDLLGTSGLYGNVVDAAGSRTARQIGYENWSPHDIGVQQWIQGRTTQVAGLVNGTTEKELRQALADVQAQGKGSEAMATAIKGYFEGHAKNRARAFARTEVIGASNYGSWQSAKQSGIVQEKTWLDTNDGRTCAECAALDGETVPLDSTFADGAQFPPDHPRCRCTLWYGIAKKRAPTSTDQPSDQPVEAPAEVTAA